MTDEDQGCTNQAMNIQLNTDHKLIPQDFAPDDDDDDGEDNGDSSGSELSHVQEHGTVEKLKIKLVDNNRDLLKD